MKQTIFIFGGLAVAILIPFQLSKRSLMGFQGNNDLFIVTAKKHQPGRFYCHAVNGRS